MNKVELQTIQNGAIIDLFNEELQKVLLNIEDENTLANAERSITIKISIKPDKTRRTAEVKAHASSKLSGTKPAETFLFFDRDKHGKFAAYVDDPGPELPGISDKTEKDNITQFPTAANGS